MSDLIKEQQPPKQTDGDVWLLVLKDMEERRKHGIEKYGVPVQPFNGRDPLIDAYQEVLDLCVYLRQAIEEREERLKYVGELKQEFGTVKNHGSCAVCGKDVVHTYPWWTGTPGKEGAKPLHEECHKELFKS